MHILKPAGEQSERNANIYEELNALEQRAGICNRVSLVTRHERREATGKLLPLERRTTDGAESHTAYGNVFFNNVVKIAVKSVS